jgi:YggT family protein
VDTSILLGVDERTCYSPVMRIEMIDFGIQFILILGNLISYAIIARILISWFAMGKMAPPGKVTMFLRDVTDPVINLARKLPHKWGMIDFAPLIALIGVDILTRVIIIGLTNLATL